ncbi:MAG TPA: short-chain fatty acyl-CoA regulator family protein [Ramlibacter sp.]
MTRTTVYGGARLRRLREQHRLTQLALARRLDLSASYVNQIENDQRPLTVPVLLKLAAAFELDPQFFAADDDARLAADLHEVLADTTATPASAAVIDELVARMPDVGRTLVDLHRRLHTATERLEQYPPHRDIAGAPAPFEQVRDFFYDRRNHIAALDAAAERLHRDHGLRAGALDAQLADILRADHDITVRLRSDPPDRPGPKRRYDPEDRVLTLPRRLPPGSRAFQLATQLAMLTQADAIDAEVADAPGLDGDAGALARIALAHYFAGAMLLPYGEFLSAAEEFRYDIELLSRRFEVGFETVCHRLSTLQRPGSRGVPFFFVRTDRAGNISKRQSATAFHFSRVGGGCPLWVVHDAFATPGRIRTQIARMPDGRTYLWIARTTREAGLGWRAPAREFAIGLGCDITHAERLVYADGLDLADTTAATPIGPGCKVCERTDCAQRAFPQLGRPLRIDPRVSDRLPYPQA